MMFKRNSHAAGSTPGNLDDLSMLKAPALSSKLVMIYGHAPPPGSNLGVDVMLLEGLFMRDITTNGYISSSTGSLLSPLHKTEDEKSQHHSTFSPNHESPRTIPTIDTNLVSLLIFVQCLKYGAHLRYL